MFKKKLNKFNHIEDDRSHCKCDIEIYLNFIYYLKIKNKV